MKKLPVNAFLTAISIAFLMFATPGAAISGEARLGLTELVSLSQSAALQSMRRDTAENTTSFCGACTKSDHDACGGQSNGWSCCSAGCSDGKMQCWNVVSCDKIAEGGPWSALEQLASGN